MEEKKQRRNKRILIISAMLVLLIALLCFGGTTFAKYITSKDAKVEQVTVAKWGFVVTVDADDMFSKQYNGGNAVKVDSPAAGTVDVNAATGNANKLVAPGTGGSMTIAINGIAEVNAEINIAQKDGTDLKDVYLHSGTTAPTEVKDATYAPIKWTLEKTGSTKAAGATAETPVAFTEVEGTLKECIDALLADGKTAVVAAGTEIKWTYTLSWAWAFDNAANADSDKYDTLLGNAVDGIKQVADDVTVGDVIVDKAAGTLQNVVTVKASETEEGKHAVDEKEEYAFSTEIAFELTVSVVQTQNTVTAP